MRKVYLRDVKTLPVHELRKATGVYKIILFDKTGAPKPICRIGGIDRQGVMYIGRSGNLRERLFTLRRMFYEGLPRGHIAALTYRACPRLKKIAPAKHLGFWFEHCADCVSEEGSILKRYFLKFGEVPPLNGRAEFVVPDALRAIVQLR